MATLILGAAGSALGGAVGGQILGASAAAIGGAIGSSVGSLVDSLIISSLAPAQRIEGPRLEDLRITSATEGAVVPRVYGTMRVGGNIIWATNFREETVRKRQGGKGGGPRVTSTEYRYYASFAVGLCEGPIGGVGRIWADGKPLETEGVVWRVYLGTEDQLPDAFIESVEGAGQVPAYRGLAYVVFEDLALAEFGNRLPQLSFEVIRPPSDPGSLEQLVGAVNLIPSAGEFVYATEAVTKSEPPPGSWSGLVGDLLPQTGGESTPENVAGPTSRPDMLVSLDRLEAALPRCEAVSLVVSWFGTDLRADACQIRPGVEVGEKNTSVPWSVNGVERADAYLVSQSDGGPAYGGTPADFAVVQAIQELKSRGKRVTFYPFVLMDVPPGNDLRNPYSVIPETLHFGALASSLSSGAVGGGVYGTDIKFIPAGSTGYLGIFTASLSDVTVGETISWAAWVRVADASTVEIGFAETGGWAKAVHPVSNGSWVRVGATGVVPAGLTRVDLEARYGALVASADLEISALSVVRGSFTPTELLPDADSSVGQPVYPWRGRITCSPAPGFAGSPDQTITASAQVAAFFGSAAPGDFAVSGETVSWTGAADDWGLRRMILHYAHLCAAAGGVDAFLIGTELRGVTTIRDGASSYPAVAELVALASDVSAILGPATKISYAADWSEYWGHNPGDGSGDFHFHLDPLWSSADVDFIGIDNYQPLSDWRDGDEHLDALAGWESVYDLAYLRANIEGGEGFDWFYASSADRDAQIRTPITDGAAGKPWVFRYKDLRSWWSNEHYNRPGGTEAGSPTAWVPGAKPFRFTEAGTAAVDRSTNQPNVFVDPKSSESFLPYYSRGWPDEALQRRYVEALIGYWSDPANNPAATLYSGRMIEAAETAIWTWDARPFPAFPARTDVWKDAENWRLGHWLTGRAGGSGLAELVRELCARAGLAPELIDTSRLAGSVPGVVVGALESPRASIETLARLYGFDAVESGGVIRFVPRGLRPAAIIAAGELVAASRDGDDLLLTRGQETELPRALKWRLPARDEEFAGITVEARRFTADSVRTVAEQLPVATTSGAAERGVRRALFEQWVGRDTASFGLPPSRLALDPADVVLLEHDGRELELTVTSVTDGSFRRIEARRSDRALTDLPPGAERRLAAPVPQPSGIPLVALMNLPRLSDEASDWVPYVAVHAAPWIGEAAVWRSAGDDGFERLTTVDAPALVGTLAGELRAGPPNRWDRGSELLVDMLAGSFASVSDTAALGGANVLAVESAPDVWEIVGFAQASLVTPGRWRLTRLLRGLLGSEDAIGDPAPIGARVVVLDPAVVPVPIRQGEFGAPWQWRVGPGDLPASDPAMRAQTFTPSGRGLRTFSPCHLRREALGGGDLRLSWTRRTRDLGGDNWSLAEAPLGEETEAYEVEILDGAAVKRILTAASPSLVYTAAQQTADFGGPVSSVRFRVFQIGALGRGPGAEGEP